MSVDTRIKALIEANRQKTELLDWNGMIDYGTSRRRFKRLAAEALNTLRTMRLIRAEQGRNYRHVVAVHMARVDDFLTLARAA